MNKRKRIVIIGGGHGTGVVANALGTKKFDISIIVAMADSGGSTGVLRRDFHMPPPGDVRQALITLAEPKNVYAKLFTHRFTTGFLAGHNFGNIFLAGLAQTSDSFAKAVAIAQNLLRTRGQVIPVTLENTNLVTKLDNGQVLLEEAAIHTVPMERMARSTLKPRARANHDALSVIRKADCIIIGPGHFHSGIIPNLLVTGIPEAIRRSAAQLIYISNLTVITRTPAHFTPDVLASIIETYLHRQINHVIFNTKWEQKNLKPYLHKNERLVPTRAPKNSKYIGAPLMSTYIPKRARTDLLKRFVARHDQKRLGQILRKLI